MLAKLRQIEQECKISSDNELALTDQVTSLMLRHKELELALKTTEEKLFKTKAELEQTSAERDELLSEVKSMDDEMDTQEKQIENISKALKSANELNGVQSSEFIEKLKSKDLVIE